MVKLKCKFCKHEWDYKGEREFYASCPDCKRQVKIRELKGGLIKDKDKNE